ncbi:MAG: hypothetical protein QOG93_2150 [Gaiellaceae bacterium]|nr:hypothetical protein [Gaiellaceae bacterium]
MLCADNVRASPVRGARATTPASARRPFSGRLLRLARPRARFQPDSIARPRTVGADVSSETSGGRCSPPSAEHFLGGRPWVTKRWVMTVGLSSSLAIRVLRTETRRAAIVIRQRRTRTSPRVIVTSRARTRTRKQPTLMSRTGLIEDATTARLRPGLERVASVGRRRCGETKPLSRDSGRRPIAIAQRSVVISAQGSATQRRSFAIRSRIPSQGGGTATGGRRPIATARGWIASELRTIANGPQMIARTRRRIARPRPTSAQRRCACERNLLLCLRRPRLMS